MDIWIFLCVVKCSVKCMLVVSYLIINFTLCVFICLWTPSVPTKKILFLVPMAEKMSSQC